MIVPSAPFDFSGRDALLRDLEQAADPIEESLMGGDMQLFRQ